MENVDSFQKEFFKENGYLILENILNSDENSSSTIHYKIRYGRHTWDYSTDENLKTSKLLWDFFRNYTKK